MKKIALLPFFFLFISLSALAEVRLPAILGDHMVLQQNAMVKLWGWSEVRESIKITTTWDTTSYTTLGQRQRQMGGANKNACWRWAL
ncbi:MAG: hypothetical protein WDN26_19920 [Chitinophagaceae bacterium]